MFPIGPIFSKESMRSSAIGNFSAKDAIFEGVFDQAILSLGRADDFNCVDGNYGI